MWVQSHEVGGGCGEEEEGREEDEVGGEREGEGEGEGERILRALLTMAVLLRWLDLLWRWACLRAVEVARELRASAAIASARASEAGELGGGSSFEGSESPPGE